MTTSLTREVHDHVKHLARPRAGIYWRDLCVSAGVGWTSVACGATLRDGPWRAVLFLVGTFALYRAVTFIHELSHLRDGDVPGFALAWNALVGVPLLLPSFLYGVHRDHHARTSFGTAADPEYLPLAQRSPGENSLLFLSGALIPPLLALRWLVAPLALVSTRLRQVLDERFSAATLRPEYRRRLPRAGERRSWRIAEVACSAWTFALVGLLASGVVPARVAAYVGGVFVAVAMVNQARTMTSHRFEGTGAKMTAEEELLDSVTVEGPPLLAELWAPFGLRYHALHHLAPSLPYHALAEAHRTLLARLPSDSPYRRTAVPGLLPALAPLFGWEGAPEGGSASPR